MSLSRVARTAVRSARQLSCLQSLSLGFAELQPTGQTPTSPVHCAVIAGHLPSIRTFASTSVEDDTHEDFRPQANSGPANSASDQIKQDIEGNKVFIYMKGDPSAPQCGFSNMACRILDAYGVEYDSRNVLADPDVREAVKQFTEWPTIPQVFVNGEFVGGSDILLSMHQSGELFSMLESNGAKPIQPRTG